MMNIRDNSRALSMLKNNFTIIPGSRKEATKLAINKIVVERVKYQLFQRISLENGLVDRINSFS
ncbi:hypothetical protein [Hydrotalea sp.]|uniref:hypothetical protein n=1 Tax=Hydrotalea sp. TaxID=2881279 RepID=UPI003D0E6699